MQLSLARYTNCHLDCLPKLNFARKKAKVASMGIVGHFFHVFMDLKRI